jgi:hypothetical protein
MEPFDSRLDIVAGGFDAGIHFGEYIEKDMIAVRVSPDLRPAIRRLAHVPPIAPKPKSPRDPVRHRCINFLTEMPAYIDGSSKGQDVSLCLEELVPECTRIRTRSFQSLAAQLTIGVGSFVRVPRGAFECS